MLFGSAQADIYINETNFPDAVFRNYLSSKYGNNSGGGSISADTIAGIEYMNLSKVPGTINNLKGIEYFTALESLNCGDKSIAALDLSANVNLIDLKLGRQTVTANCNFLNDHGDAVCDLDIAIGAYGDISKVSVPESEDYTYDKNSRTLAYTTDSEMFTYTYDTGCALDGGIMTVNVYGNQINTTKGIKIDETNFPDKVFRDHLSRSFDLNSSGFLSTQEVNSVRY